MAFRVLTALILTSALGVGCGGDGSDGDGSEPARADPRLRQIESCLEDRFPGFVSTQKADLDRIAAVAKGGGIAVHTETQEINVSLVESPRQARRAIRFYGSFDQQPARLESKENAVVAYTRKPTRRELRLVDPCFR